jgi:phosphoribosylglycinamide formyltransferase-1
MNKTRIAVFASGTGSNAINLIRYFNNHPTIEIGFVLSNKSDAPVLNSAKDLGITVIHHTNDEVANGDFLVQLCQSHQINWIMLAGYLRLIPGQLIQQFENKIINLHPSLLPKHGGKGMHGGHVHEAVINNKEIESGITIHFVNEEFDKGRILAQFRCSINSNDTNASLAQKIHVLEQSYLPVVVEKTIINS